MVHPFHHSFFPNDTTAMDESSNTAITFVSEQRVYGNDDRGWAENTLSCGGIEFQIGDSFIVYWLLGISDPKKRVNVNSTHFFSLRFHYQTGGDKVSFIFGKEQHDGTRKAPSSGIFQ
jgi:hypothetical protein